MRYFKHKKSLGQHFLVNPHVSKTMCALLGDISDIPVLEIGPGTGALTETLLEKGGRVFAIETDARAILVLNERFEKEVEAGQLTLIEKDVRAFIPAEVGLRDHGYVLIGNIPYYLSGFLFRMFLETSAQPSQIVFLVQKEVAKRITDTKKESLLSLGVKAYGTPHYVQSVGRGNFSPPPKVDSAIISITDISRDSFQNLSEAFFFELLHLGFSSKRKQLFGSLSKQFPRDALMHTFSTLNISPAVRGEDLGVDMWLNLARALAINMN